MAVGIFPSPYPRERFARLADRPVGDAHWPIGGPAHAATLGDLTEHDHLVLTLHSRSVLADRRGLRCRVSLRIIEPPVIHRRYYRLAPWVAAHYHRVLTHSTRLLRRLPNARFMPHGDTLLGSESTGDHPKTGLVSMIASPKRFAPGHKLRHRIAEWSTRERVGVRLFGSGYERLDDKRLGHDPFRYSVVIENSRQAGYFSEKLVDSLLCSSLPIYWGAPDIEHFFDPRGMIVCRNERQLRDAIAGANAEDFARRAPYLAENRRKALHFAKHLRNCALLLMAEDEVERGAGVADAG